MGEATKVGRAPLVRKIIKHRTFNRRPDGGGECTAED